MITVAGPSRPLPIQETVRDFLADLLGKGVAVDKTPPFSFEDDEVGAVACYVGDSGVTGALFLADCGLACRVGAALSMVPAAVAEESVKRNEIPENLLENLQEVANIFCRLVNHPKASHLKLGDVLRIPGELPNGVASIIARPGARRDFVVQIEGYGTGKLALLVS